MKTFDVIVVTKEYRTVQIDAENEETRLEAILQFLFDRTWVCGVTDDGSIVYQSF